MYKKGFALTITLITLFLSSFSSTAIKADVTVNNLLTENMYTWYNANSGGITGNTNYAGAYVMKPIGDNLYIGFNASVPASDSRGVILAKHDGTTLTKISNLTEDAISRLKVVNDKLVFPGYDPNGSDDWDGGNYYIYDPTTETLSKKRYRYNSYQFVDATTTDSNGNYSFTGLKNTAYLVKVIKPANTIFSPAKVGGLGTYDADSDVNATTGEYLTCTGSKYQGFKLLSADVDNTIDAGLRTSAGAPAGTATSGTRNETFFTGNYSIGNRIWNDTDNDGRQDGGETGRSGVRVELYTKDPYFPCVVHMNATYGEGNDLYAIGGRPAPVELEGFGNIAGSGHAIFKSTDGGNEWAPIYEDYGSGYFPYDMTKVGNYYFKNSRFSRYNDAEPWDAYLKVLLQYSTDLTTWSYYEDPRKVIDDTLMSDGYVYDVYSSNFSFYNEMLEFKDSLVFPNVLGDKIYRVTDPASPEVLDINGANFSEIIDSYDDSDKLFPEMSNADAGMANRYNTFVNVDDNYLYGIGGDKKVYVSTNISNWLQVADFSSIGSGAEPISISYWPAEDKVLIATAGQNGSIYYINHSDVVNGVISRINNLSDLDFFFEAENVNLKTIGTSLSSIEIAIKDGLLLLSKVSTTFSTPNLDWTNVTGESDLVTGKAVIKNLTTAPGTSATHTLYVPIPNGNPGLKFLLCPNAETLADITYTCTNGVLFENGETKDVLGSSVTVIKVNEGGQDYWVAEGVTGTGGFAYVPQPDPEPDPDTDPEENNNNNQNNQNQGNTNNQNNSNPQIYSPTLPIGSSNENIATTVPTVINISNTTTAVSYPITTNNPSTPDDTNKTVDASNNDNSNSTLWLIFLVASLIIVFIVVKVRKNKNKDDWNY